MDNDVNILIKTSEEMFCDSTVQNTQGSLSATAEMPANSSSSIADCDTGKPGDQRTMHQNNHDQIDEQQAAELLQNQLLASAINEALSAVGEDVPAPTKRDIVSKEDVKPAEGVTLVQSNDTGESNILAEDTSNKDSDSKDVSKSQKTLVKAEESCVADQIAKPAKRVSRRGSSTASKSSAIQKGSLLGVDESSQPYSGELEEPQPEREISPEREVSPPRVRARLNFKPRFGRVAESAHIRTDAVRMRMPPAEMSFAGGSKPTQITKRIFGGTGSGSKSASLSNKDEAKNLGEFRVHIRIQPNSRNYVNGDGLSDTGDLSATYSCFKCSFKTSRINNLVHHHKEKCAFAQDVFWDDKMISEANRVPSPKKTVCSTPVAQSKKSGAKRKGVANNQEGNEKKRNKQDDSKTKSAGASQQRDPLEEGDEDELPDCSEVLTQWEFGGGDVVWVEWKRLHWPALVLKINHKLKKARLLLIDHQVDNEPVLVSVKKICHFNDAERNKRYLNEGRVGRNSGALTKAVQKAEDFLRKKCLGDNYDPVRFFKEGQLTIVEEQYAESSSSESLGPPSPMAVSEDEQCEQSSQEGTTEPAAPAESVHEWSLSPPSPREGAVADSQEEVARAKEKRRQANSKLVACIKNGQVEAHLLGIFRGTVPSERHDKFHSNLISQRNQIKQMSWFGPVDDESQQEEIYEYCFDLLKSNCDVDETFDAVSYVFEVFCPEAVMKAIQKLRRCSLLQAAAIFNRGVAYTKGESDASLKELVTGAAKMSEEERLAHAQRTRDELRDMGVDESVLRALDI